MVLREESKDLILTNLIHHGKFYGKTHKSATQGNAQALHSTRRTVELDEEGSCRGGRRDWRCSEDSRVISSMSCVIRSSSRRGANSKRLLAVDSDRGTSEAYET